MAIDAFAKEYLHDNLRWARSDLLGKLEGLSEYDARRPLARTGTNLLGLVKHVTISDHLGQADVVREEIDGALGSDPAPSTAEADENWASHRARIEAAAQAAGHSRWSNG